jgi:hypothetical protein
MHRCRFGLAGSTQTQPQSVVDELLALLDFGMTT